MVSKRFSTPLGGKGRRFNLGISINLKFHVMLRELLPHTEIYKGCQGFADD